MLGENRAGGRDIANLFLLAKLIDIYLELRIFFWITDTLQMLQIHTWSARGFISDCNLLLVCGNRLTKRQLFFREH